MKHLRRREGQETDILVPRFAAPFATAAIIGLSAMIAWKAQHGIPWYSLSSDWMNSRWALFPERNALFGHSWRLGASAVFIVGLAALGTRFIRSLGLALENDWERTSFGYLMGGAAVSTSTLLLGLLGLWNPFTLRAIFLGVALAGMGTLLGQAARLRGLIPAMKSLLIFDFKAVGIAALFLLWALNLRIALTPETFYDALVYHLGLPQLYVNVQRLPPTGWNSYAGIPSQTQMANVLAMSADPSGIIANLLHSATLILIWTAFCSLAARMGSVNIGRWAIAIFSLTPVVLAESFRTSVGLELTLMQFGFFAALIYSLLEGDEKKRRSWLFVAGTCLGSAAATKYTAWILPISLAAFLNFDKLKSDDGWRPLSIAEASFVLTVCAIWLSPWIMKNMIQYQNPVFPFFHEFIAQDSAFHPNWSALAGPRAFGDLFTLPGLARFISHPISMLAPKEEISESIGVAIMSAACYTAFFRHSGLSLRLVLFCVLS